MDESPATRPDEESLAAWRALLSVHALATSRLDAELREAHDIPIEWYDVLVQLHEHGGRLRMSELADAALFSRSNCTRIVDRMVRDGLVAREPDPDDRRGRHAVVTGEGRALLRRAGRTHLAGIRREFADRLRGDEAATLARILGRLATELREELPDERG